MKKCLFQIDKSKRTCLDQEYFVDVYEFNGEDFYMLIRCLDAYCDSTFSRRDCYSLISSYHMEVFSKNKFIYGYTDFEIEDIFHVFEKDACSSEQWDDNTFTTKYVNRIMRPEQISDSAGYSEIQMVNRPISKNRYRSIRPNYLVVFDKIEEKHLKEANRLGIPIVKINTSKYLSKIMEGKKKRNDLGFEKFERIFDSYTNGYEFEKEKNSRR